MLIELAHYTLIFAVAAVGLQTLLLSPTLWSSGSAVAIKLGFRGACCTATLLLFSFLTLLYSYTVYDFSVAVVFETFDTRSSFFYALPALCSSREGFFFTFIIFLSVFHLIGFSKKDLATYQERGRYLFAGGFLIFLLLVLMLATADPFARIAEPPFEGVGFNPEWRPPYRILYLLLSFAAYGVLTITLIKLISMYSKGRQFVTPALKSSLFALICLTAALGIELLTRFTATQTNPLWQWTPGNSLQFAVFVLTVGQVILLFFCLYSRVFTNWILVFAFFSAAFFAAHFFAAEYKLFSLSANEVYFPNPVTALSAAAGMTCFLLFFCSAVIKKSLPENNFSLFSRESFIGMAAAALLAMGTIIGSLSLLPTLFMFLPDLPLRLLPALFKDVLIWTGIAFTIFFVLGFKRRSLVDGWIKTNWKNAFIFWGIALVGIGVCLLNLQNAEKIILSVLPSVFIFRTALASRYLKMPKSINDLWHAFKGASAFSYGIFFATLSFLVFSAGIADAVFNRTETVKTVKIEEAKKKDGLPCLIETLSRKTDEATAQYRLVCGDSVHLLDGNPVFQWREKELNAKLLKIQKTAIVLTEAVQVQENYLRLNTIRYPGLRLVGSALFLMCLGQMFLIFSLRREQSL